MWGTIVARYLETINTWYCCPPHIHRKARIYVKTNYTLPCLCFNHRPKIKFTGIWRIFGSHLCERPEWYVLVGFSPPVETLRWLFEAATSSPVTKTVCLQWKCGANTVHFGQHDDVVTLWLSHQELAVERNVDVCEELLQGRVGVQEQQPNE